MNGQWDFRLFPAGAEEEEKAFAANRSAYDRAIAVPFSWVCPLSGVEEDVAGIGWYRRAVSYQKKNRLFLCFGAVDYKADVYINGTHAGSHQGGYSYFEMEITALWREGENIIEVRAEDYRQETQLYGKQGYGEIQGIWQTVWLEDRPQAYIQDWQVVTHINGEVEIAVQADAADGSEICACFGGQCWKSAVRQGAAKLSLTMENPRLWSPDSPYLYEGSLKLGDDEVFTYFGIREIRAGNVDGRGYKWILLNGKPIYLNGTLDQAFHPRGHFTYPSDQDMYDEAWRLKRLGLNMVAHPHQAGRAQKALLDGQARHFGDGRHPLLLGRTHRGGARRLRGRIARNHRPRHQPSATFAWVVFNESWGLLHGKRDDKVYLPETQEWVRSITTRRKRWIPIALWKTIRPARYDHVETDLNTWHFYLNGYEIVRDHIRKVVEETYRVPRSISSAKTGKRTRR